MDKETLSNYGWVVAVILVLAIMITLATPFGNVIKGGVEKQVNTLKGTASGALDSAGGANSFNDLNSGGSPAVAGSATFDDGSGPVTLTWEELKDPTNGALYGYDASAISDTSIGDDALSWIEPLTNIIIPDGVTSIGGSAFEGCYNLASVTIPDSVTSIGGSAFAGTCLTSVTIPGSMTSIGTEAFTASNLSDVYYNGTTAQWNALVPDTVTTFPSINFTVHCSDGDVAVNTLP